MYINVFPSIKRTGADPASFAAITLKRNVFAAVRLTSSLYKRNIIISPLALMRKIALNIPLSPLCVSCEWQTIKTQ